MAINMNYSLINGEANNDFDIPDYGNKYNTIIYTESTVMNAVSDFRNILREVSYELNNIPYMSEYEYGTINEANIIKNIVNTVVSVINKLINAIKILIGKILTIIKNVLDKISGKNSKKDEVSKKYSTNERLQLLDRVLNSRESGEPYTISISDINPTEKLVGKDFPNTNVVSNELVDMVGNSLYNFGMNYHAKNGQPETYKTDADASESMATFIATTKKEILDRIFSPYSYDPTNIIMSAKSVSDEAFGSTDVSDVPVTTMLYSQACDNIENGNSEIIKSMKNELRVFETSYRNIIRSLSDLRDNFIKGTKNWSNKSGNPEKIDGNYNTFNMRSGFDQATDTVVKSVNSIVNNINTAISANISIISHKIKRLDQVFGNSGDSAKVRNYCHQLINLYIGTEAKNEAFNVNLIDDYEPFLEEQEKFNIALNILEDCWMENAFNSYIEQVLLEDGATNTTGNTGTGQASGNPAPGTTPNGQQQNTANTQQNQNNGPTQNDLKNRKVGQKLKDFIAKIVANIVNMFNKFKNRISQLTTKIDKPFWDRNRSTIQNTDFSKTTVNDWYCYDLESLKEPIVSKINSKATIDNAIEWANDEKKFQELILNTINPSKPSWEADDDSFATKVSKRYYTNYINKDATEVSLNTIGFHGDQTFEFIENVIRGKSDQIKSFDDDIKSIKDRQREADSLKNTGADAMQNSVDANNESYIPRATDEINLAEIFGLSQKIYSEELPFIYTNEAINIPQDVKQNADSQQTGEANRKGAMDTSSRFYTMYFKLMSTAVTARMTTIMSAYKQYMRLYKALFQKSKDDKNNNQDNKNQNQQQQSTAEKK